MLSQTRANAMGSLKDSRDTVLKASRAYYAHLGYYEELAERSAAQTKRELDFLEFAFGTHASHRVKDVLDIACGSGRHLLGLAQRGYQCTGQDYTPEQVEIAKARAKSDRLTLKLRRGDATKLTYENEFDAVLALYVLFLLPDDDGVLTCLKQIHRALRSGGIMVCNVSNPFHKGKDWFSLETIHKGHYSHETRIPQMRYITIDRVKDFDPVHGVAWWQETHIIEEPQGMKVFRENERVRLFTYWDILHYLQTAGFKKIKCYPDWKTKPSKKPKADWLVFVAQKD
jgi:SAM-dependent methyltransferase